MRLKNYYFLLAILIAFFGLFITIQTASAGGIPGLSEIPSSEGALSAVEEISGPIIKQIWDILWSLVKSLGLLWVSALLLDKAMEANIDLGDTLVTTGWAFTLSLTNLIFIFVIIYIAIKQITSDEEDMSSIKKYLPRLVTTILLVNFGVVFVKMGLDIAFILQHSMVPSGTSLAMNSIASLGGQLTATISFLIIYLGIGVAVSWLPIAAAAWQMAALPAFIIMAPTIISAAIQTFICNILSATYFGFAIYFVIRIYVIKILTIIFPLAFACRAIPNETAQKLWKQWTNIFISWTFFAIPLLFFMVLGLKLLQGIVPAGMASLATPFAWGQIIANQGLIADAMNYYIAMIAYLATLAYLKIKFTPKVDIFGVKMTEMAKSGGMAVLSRLRPLANTTKQNLSSASVAYREEQKAREVPGSAAAGKWAKRGTMEKIGGALNAATVWTVEKNLEREGTTPEMEISKKVDAQQKAYEKKFGKDTESATKVFNSFIASGPDNFKSSIERAAFASYLAKNAKGGKGVREALAILGGKKSIEMAQDAKNAKKGDAADALIRSMVGNGTFGSSKRELEEIERVVGSAEPEDMNQFAPGFEKDETAKKTIVSKWETGQLTASTKGHRGAVLKAYADEVNSYKTEEEFETFAKEHSGQVMFLIGTAGQRAGAILRDKEGNARGKKDIERILGFKQEKKEGKDKDQNNQDQGQSSPKIITPGQMTPEDQKKVQDKIEEIKRSASPRIVHIDKNADLPIQEENNSKGTEPPPAQPTARNANSPIIRIKDLGKREDRS